MCVFNETIKDNFRLTKKLISTQVAIIYEKEKEYTD